MIYYTMASIVVARHRKYSINVHFCLTDPCDNSQFYCGGHKCILQAYVCDRDNDCDDMSDEANCEYCGGWSGDANYE